MLNHRAVVALALLAVAPACQKSDLVQPGDLARGGTTGQPPPPPPTTPPASPEYAASRSGPTDPDCAAPIHSGAEQKLTLNGKPASLNGTKLTLTPSTGPTAIGIVASLNDPSPTNLKAFDRYIAAFKGKGAQAILVAGDSGDTAAAISGSLRPFAKSGLPVLVLIGNRESKANFVEAVTALQKQFPNVINLNQVRQVELGSLTVLSLPGYHDGRFLIAGQSGGCLYHTEDLAALKEVASKVKTPILLAAHGQPHQEGPKGIDRTAAPSVNVGDPNLTQLLVDAHIPFGVFANIIEAGGTASNLKGDQSVVEGAPADELYLNPGAADATPWAMNDGTSAKGLAAIFELKDGKGSFTVVRANPPAAK